MFDDLSALLELGGGELVLCAAVVFVAGLVRGFSGFALSALIMASLAVVIPPVSLIPVCYVLEGTASALMFRGGTRAADWRVVWGLALGSALGMPLGLYATVHLPIDVSRTVALALIAALAALQLAGRAPTFLGTRGGLYASGLLAGIVTGLANVGGMIVALYVLARDAPPARMRASLVMFLFVGMFTSGVWLVLSGVLDRLALVRGLAFAPLVAVGVLLGSALFRPALQGLYRRFCLLLLVGLALVGLVRVALVGRAPGGEGAQPLPSDVSPERVAHDLADHRPVSRRPGRFSGCERRAVPRLARDHCPRHARGLERGAHPVGTALARRRRRVHARHAATPTPPSRSSRPSHPDCRATLADPCLLGILEVVAVQALERRRQLPIRAVEPRRSERGRRRRCRAPWRRG